MLQMLRKKHIDVTRNNITDTGGIL